MRLITVMESWPSLGLGSLVHSRRAVLGPGGEGGGPAVPQSEQDFLLTADAASGLDDIFSFCDSVSRKLCVSFQPDRQTDRRCIDTQAHTHTHRQTQMYRQTVKQRDTHTDRQIHRRTDRHQTDIRPRAGLRVRLEVVKVARLSMVSVASCCRGSGP